MTDRRCRTCGDEGFNVGSCPECGLLPAVHLVGSDESMESQVRRVTTTAARSRRVATVVVIVVGGLFTIGMLLDGGDATVEPSDQGESAAAARLTQENPGPAVRESLPLLDRMFLPQGRLDLGERRWDDQPVPVEFDGMVDFAGQWLVMISHTGGVWQVPLGGGQLTQVAPDGHPTRSVGDPVAIIDGILHSTGGAVSLIDGETWRRFPGQMVGAMDDGSIMFTGSESLVQWRWFGEEVTRWVSPVMAQGQGVPVAVVGRQAIHDGPNGIFRFDLDTGDIVRVATGQVVRTGSASLLALVCDDTFVCEHRIVDVMSGAVRSVVDVEPRPWDPLAPPTYSGVPQFSPDDSRLVMVDGSVVQLIDTTTGSAVGAVELGEMSLDLGGRVSTIWAPSGRSALLIAHQSRGPIDVMGVTVVAVLDAESGELTHLQVLQALLNTAGQPGDRTFLLSDQGFAPLAANP